MEGRLIHSFSDEDKLRIFITVTFAFGDIVDIHHALDEQDSAICDWNACFEAMNLEIRIWGYKIWQFVLPQNTAEVGIKFVDLLWCNGRESNSRCCDRLPNR